MAATGRLAVLAPAPHLTVTVERSTTGTDEVHLHPGGQGYWMARLAAELGASVTLCTTLGGEAGRVVEHLLAREPLAVEAVATGANGSYVHDRRSGRREVVAQTPPVPLDRHGADDLYGLTLVAALETGTLALAGSPGKGLVPDGFYERLARDARSAGVTVVADLSGPQLDQALRGGIDVLKVSSEELARDGLVVGAGDETLRVAMARLRDRGAASVVVTREGAGSLVLGDDHLTQVVAPRVHPLEPAGAGDSLTGAVAALLARGEPLLGAIRVGTAAATLNVTRRGLGSGRRSDIERLAARVELRTLEPGQPAGAG